MAASPHFELVSGLAKELGRGDIELPSFPDNVLRIKQMLDKDDVLIVHVSQAVNSDPVLVSRLLVFANSALYNPSGVRIESLDIAISRLGFDLVRNTAVSLAVKQMFVADKHRELMPALREIWQKSMQLAALSATVAANRGGLNHESAFLCGLVHEVGRLYLLTRLRDYPEISDNPEELAVLLADWHPKVGKMIVESWKFAEDIVASVDPLDSMSEFTHDEPTLADAVYVADLLLQDPAVMDGDDDEAREALVASSPAFTRLQIDSAHLMPLHTLYQERLSAVREALTG